jgi:TonB family protein
MIRLLYPYLFVGCLCAFADRLLAQTPSTDTTIYNIADQAPYALFKSCLPAAHPGWNVDSMRRCAERQLLGLVAQNIRYPEAARQKNVEGVVVAQFVVEKDGKMSNLNILKDIGDGCGTEAMRVLQALAEAGLSWQPALIGGKPVRMKTVLPLRFRLQEALPYYIGVVGDTIYTLVETQPDFKGGADSLAAFLLNRLTYPAAYRDSCKTGIVETTILLRHDGQIAIDNQADFSNLGSDFAFEAIRLVNRSTGRWKSASYQGRPVSTMIPVRALFKSPKAGCKTANDRFDRALLLADEGATLLEQKQPEPAVAKLTEALALDPNNSETLLLRGNAYLDLNKRDEACRDFNRVRALLGPTSFEGLRRALCGMFR